MFALASSAWKSSPLIPGNLTSSTRQLATSASLLRKKSAVEPNVSTLSLTDRNRLLSASRMDSSSSTTNTVGSSAAADGRAGRSVTGFPPDGGVSRKHSTFIRDYRNRPDKIAGLSRQI